MKFIIYFLLIIVVFGSCQKTYTRLPDASTLIPQLKFKNVVILGNSITFTPSNPVGEWKGNWGMAASAADSDFVHRLAVSFRKFVPSCKVTARNIAEFELYYNNYDFNANLMVKR